MPPEPLSLPWFLDLGTGQLVRKRKSVVRYGPGAGSARVRVLGPNEQILQLDALTAALDGSWTDAPVVSLHALACAERAIDLLEEMTTVAPKWSFEGRLRLYTHAIEVLDFEDFEGSWGSFERAVGRISFAYVANDPWRTASLSHDLVLHEICHAFLDGWKGWYVTSGDLGTDDPAAAETGAVSECLGDLLAMASAGRLVESRQRALQDTGGELSGNPNNLSRFAELPGYARILRDLSKRVSRDDAEHLPNDDPRRPYVLAAGLGSAIYEAITQRCKSLGNDEAALQRALEEVLGGAFSSLRSLPTGRVTITSFVTAAVASCESSAQEALSLALEERGFAG